MCVCIHIYLRSFTIGHSGWLWIALNRGSPRLGAPWQEGFCFLLRGETVHGFNEAELATRDLEHNNGTQLLRKKREGRTRGYLSGLMCKSLVLW